MVKTCLICGKQFETEDKRRKYCSAACMYQSRLNKNSHRMRIIRTEDRREWARKEAEYLNHLAYECGVDDLADYIYNNYNKRSK